MVSAFFKRFRLFLIGVLVLLLSSQHTALAQKESAGGAQGSLSELAQNAKALNLVPTTPIRGAVTNISDLLRTEESAKVLNNLQMLKQGIWTNQGIGWQKERAGVFNSGAQFMEFAVHQPTTGGDKLMFMVGDKVYLYDLASHTETLLYTAASAPTKAPCIRSHSPTSVILTDGDGAIEPKGWDGDSTHSFGATGLYSWPVTVLLRSFSKPKVCEPFAGRMAYAGFATYSNTVLLSSQDTSAEFRTYDPVRATDAGYLEVPAALGPIVGLRALKLDTTSAETVLLIGCTRGFALVTGSSALDFACIELTREFGLASNRTWVQLNNDMYFLATDGIRKFSSLGQNATLSNQTVSFGISNLISRINKDKADLAWAVHHPQTQEVQFWFPIDSGTQCDHGVVLNYNTNQLSSVATNLSTADIQSIWSSRDGTSISSGIDFGGIMYGGGYTGYLQTHYTGDTYDGGAISWNFVSQLVGANNPAQAISLRRWVILTDGGDQKFTAEAYTLTQRADNTTGWKLADSANINLVADSVTTVDTWSSGTTTTYPKFIDFYPKGSGRFWALKLKGTSTSEKISLVGAIAFTGVGGLHQ